MVPVVTAVVGLSSGTCGSSGLRALSSDCVAKAKMCKISGAYPPIRRLAWLIPLCLPLSLLPSCLSLLVFLLLCFPGGPTNLESGVSAYSGVEGLSAYLIPKNIFELHESSDTVQKEHGKIMREE